MTAPSNNFDFQNFYETTLSSDIVAGTLTIPLSTAPSPSEGILVINPDGASPECIFYTSKGASSVTCPADGRGWDSTTAQSWTQGTTVIMAPTGYMFRMMKTGSLYDTYRTGWTNLGYTPATVTANGNRSYDAVISSVDLTSTVSPGMRLRIDRTTVAPTQCTSLNGTTQYWVKTTPNKLTFTDDFVVSAWVKQSAYSVTGTIIASRYNGTSGWALYTNPSGQVVLQGFNAGSANSSLVTSHQSIPLNKWVHITAQLDMSTFTATTTTSYVMLDGRDVPAFVSRSGTNPTALVQAGNLEIGSWNGGLIPFSGKIAQVAIYNAKVTQATILASISQGLSGSETSLASAYSFNNSTSDLNTATPNDLSAGAGAPTATNADSPFGVDGTGTPGVYDYALIMKTAYSGGNTTLTLQVPEGCTIPTSGTIDALAYSVQGNPVGWIEDKNRWMVESRYNARTSKATPTTGTAYSVGSEQINVPTGKFRVGYQVHPYATAGSGAINIRTDLNATTATVTATSPFVAYASYNNASTESGGRAVAEYYLAPTAQTTYYLNAVVGFTGASGTLQFIHDLAAGYIYAIPAGL